MTTQISIPEESLHLRAVLDRDGRYDGVFVYGVRSTGIYCRPSCPSRRPRLDSIALFSDPNSAEASGFRACLRCHPKDDRPMDADAQVVVTACRYLQSVEGAPPALEAWSTAVGTAPARLTQAFQRVLGVTPWQYADALQTERLKAGLRSAPSVTDAVYEAGYSSPSRVYERANRLLGMTPRAYRNGGEGMCVSYAVIPCFAGYLLLAATEKGVCAVQLGDDASQLEATLHSLFPAADITRDDAALTGAANHVLGLLDAVAPTTALPLDIQATAFQRRVWKALQAIPYGEVRTYGQVAQAIGQPTAVRAVATACASNPVAIVVPCHRVVPASGGNGGYRWGKERKAALLEHERREE